ncbi:MAG: hypothetical protein H6P98_2887, partial [Candidatus Aminicenantes bacterium]|nr:hypothetical protein [Candidatus Aminicenantes bacterium]
MEKWNSIGLRSQSLRRRAFRVTALAVPVFLSALFILWGAVTPPGVQDSQGASNLDGPGLTSISMKPQQKLDRKRLDQLVSEEKFEEAAKEAARLREEAKKAGDDSGWAWALIKEVQLRIALHGYETSVRFLKEETWPQSRIQRDMLDLFYAQSLTTYYEAYSWEINRRERVEAKGPVDLKAWTRERIFEESWTTLLRVWEDRGRLQDFKPKDFPDYWSAGDYPPGIRSTLRDSAVYLMARLLVDTGFWTPRQTNELFLLNLESLSGDPAADKSAAEFLKSPTAHPLEKLAALLGEHETFCRRSGRPEGALEARLERLQALHQSFTQEEDRARILKRLAEFLPKYRNYPWWATGQAVMAEWTRAENAADSLIHARRLAQDGVGAFPNSPGGQRCLNIVKSIEAPHFSFEIMLTDAPGKRSIRITHRNLDRLFFRAFPVDLMERIRTSKDYNLFPEWQEAQAVLEKQRPVAVWESDLPATPDYKDHRTYVDLPPGILPGSYLVFASAREDFVRKKNYMEAHPIMVADLVVLKRGASRGGEEALVVSGETGKPIAEAKVDLYAFDWQSGHTLIESRITDADGRALFVSRRRSGPFFLLAKKGKDMILDSSYLYLYGREKPRAIVSALIYTDRSIYRPGQKLYWKILAYAGRTDIGRVQPAANSPATVWLEDINGERVAEAVRTTNDFGTASGEFVIPAAGRPLGAWRIRTQPEGYAQVRVEEYKRPTFEVAVKDPEKALRLNRPAALKGEARYYFGLPVASGTAVWQVKRAPVYPRWWWWDSGGTQAQVVAGGRSPLQEDGTFEVSFTPRVDERKDRPEAGLTYSYTLSVDVTDEGGETRSASRTFRLGFVSVEARIAAESGFFR